MFADSPPVLFCAALPGGVMALPFLVMALACRGSDPGKHPSGSGDTDSSPPESHVDSAPPPDSDHSGSPPPVDTSTPPDTAAEPVVAFSGARPTNLLIISLDTTRRDQIGHFTGLDTTPFLDSVLAQGVVLADHHTCSNWTA